MNLFRSKDYVSLGTLLGANLLPLGGVFFAGWDAGTIVLLYWAENLIVGFYNAVKLALLKPAGVVGQEMTPSTITVPFFCVHYGMFCIIHGFFVLLLISSGPWGVMDLSRLKFLFGQILWPFFGLFVSHGVSFVENTLIRGEYKTITVRQQMMQPYGRIVVLQIAVMFAFFLFIMSSHSSFPLLVSLIGGKILLDLILHARSHRVKPAGPTPPASPVEPQDDDAAP
jgi:hypothetical protein